MLLFLLQDKAVLGLEFDSRFLQLLALEHALGVLFGGHRCDDLPSVHLSRLLGRDLPKVDPGRALIVRHLIILF